MIGSPRVHYRKTDSTNQRARELADEQDRVLGKAGSGAQKIYSYQDGLNGFAARMTPAQAQKVQHFPEVLNVWEDEVRPLATRHSPSFLGLFDGDSGLRSVAGLDGVFVGPYDLSISLSGGAT